jgi:DNA repair protein SbcD/Mre11
LEKSNKLAVGILMADTHLSEHTVEQNLSVFTQVFALCKQLGIENVFHLGDIFNSRKGQPEIVLNTFKAIIDQAAEDNLRMFAIPGNHDKTSYISDSSFLDVFQGTNESFMVLSTSSIFRLGEVELFFLPYYDEHLVYNTKLDEVLQLLDDNDTTQHPHKILLTHCAIDGVVNNGGVQMKDEVSLEKFSRFSKVFVGHYHNRQTFANIIYTGSTDPRNFGEDSYKGCTILYEDGTHEFINLDFRPYVTVDLLASDLDAQMIGKAKEKAQEAYVRFRIQGEVSEGMQSLVNQLREGGIKVLIEKEIVIGDGERASQVTFTDSDILQLYDQWSIDRNIPDPSFGEKLLRRIDVEVK